MSRKLIVVEPQCRGFEHVPFNSALLSMLCQGYKDCDIYFYADEEHIRYVEKEIFKVNCLTNICYIPISVPDKAEYGIRRLFREYVFINNIFTETALSGVLLVVFSSVTEYTVLINKVFNSRSFRDFHYLMIFHGVLAGLYMKPRRPMRWLLSIRNVLLLRESGKQKNLVLGEPILQNLFNQVNITKKYWDYIDHMLLPPSEDEFVYRRILGLKKICFGYIGVTSTKKGFDLYCKMINDLGEKSSYASFVLAGYCNDKKQYSDCCKSVEGFGYEPLSQEEMSSRLKLLTYFIWTGSQIQYKLTASGSFIDSLAYMIPGIYIRNDYVEYYFKKYGDIGYLCDNYEHLIDVVKDLINYFPYERYNGQIENIRKVRMDFSCATVFKRFKNIVGEL